MLCDNEIALAMGTVCLSIDLPKKSPPVHYAFGFWPPDATTNIDLLHCSLDQPASITLCFILCIKFYMCVNIVLNMCNCTHESTNKISCILYLVSLPSNSLV